MLKILLRNERTPFLVLKSLKIRRILVLQYYWQKSHKKNILKSSATLNDLYLALDFLTNTNSVTGHISLLDGGAHLAPPLRDVAL